MTRLLSFECEPISRTEYGQIIIDVDTHFAGLVYDEYQAHDPLQIDAGYNVFSYINAFIAGNNFDYDLQTTGM